MTPEQLERIKACLENSEYSETTNCIRSNSDQRPFAFITYQIFDPALVGQFITDAINEKLARTEHQLTYFANQKKTGPLPADLFPPKIVITEHKPIQLKNLKDPE